MRSTLARGLQRGKFRRNLVVGCVLLGLFLPVVGCSSKLSAPPPGAAQPTSEQGPEKKSEPQQQTAQSQPQAEPAPATPPASQQPTSAPLPRTKKRTTPANSQPQHRAIAAHDEQYPVVEKKASAAKAAAPALYSEKSSEKVAYEQKTETALPTEQASEPPPPAPPPTIEAAPAAAAVPSASYGASGGGRHKAMKKATEPNYDVVRVFYATDRKATGSLVPAKFYGGIRSEDETLSLGTLDVSIPRDHHVGEIERPSIWKMEFREDPEKHVVLLSVKPQPAEQYYQELSQQVGESVSKGVFVFIHGFDNTFEDAAWRTAQLAHDLEFDGVPIMYSWPSRGKVSAYAADEATVEWSTPHLEKFLRSVATRSHATTIHLIAHSMGNRALARALNSIAADHSAILPMFKQVFLAAPDIDVDVFKQLAAVFPNAASHVTVYASSKDKAIMASRKFHQNPRIGDSTLMEALTNVDMIDATAVDTGLIGHSYYGDNRSILSDIYAVIHSGGLPAQRFGMKPMPSAQHPAYWAFVP